MSEKKRLRLLIGSAALVVSTIARADLTFNLSYSPGIDPQALAGFQAAAARWSANFSDNITINLQVGFSSLSAGTLGQTAPTESSVTYSNFRSALISHADPLSADDSAATSVLPTGVGVAVEINHTATSTSNYLDSNTSGSTNKNNNDLVQLTYANERVLGLQPASNTTIDASITFSNQYSFDFDPTDGITAGKLDFVGIATHEIGHALGFDSGVDGLDSNPNQAEGSYRLMPLDLFRYSADYPGVIDFTADSRAKYFSLDKGATAIAQFSTGVTYGDGNQASHWKDNLGLGIMDPTFGYGELENISNNDRRAFDVIGYTRNYNWKWTDTSSASKATWSNAADWNADGIPDTTVTAIFNNNAASAYTLHVTSAATASAITIDTDKVLFSLESGSMTAGALTLGAASGDAATLNLQRLSGTGGLSAATIAIGSVANSTGSLNVMSGNLSGGSLSVGGTSATSAGAGSLAISGGNVSLTGNLKIWGTSASAATLSSGTLTVGGSSTIAANGKLAVNGGAFNTNGLSVSGTYSQTAGSATLGAVTVNAGASFTAKQINASSMSISAPVTISPNAGVASSIGSLSITSSGKLDVNNNSIIVPYTGSSPAASIRQLLAKGDNGGSWQGAGGITSTSASSDTNFLTGVGYAEASQLGATTFGGKSITGNAVLVKYTYYGDDDLDGKVTLNDFSIFVDGFNGLGTGWVYGDYDYNGVTNLSDFSMFVDSYRNQGASLSSLEQMVTSDANLSASQRFAMLSVVPEPASAGVMGMLALGLLRRSRRSGQAGFIESTPTCRFEHS